MNLKTYFMALAFGICSLSGTAQATFQFGTKTNPQGVSFEVDSRGFIVGGRHVLPVMGEMHYARVPRKDWRREIRKMKAGGINILSTYSFWIHHEPVEGQWDWSGNNDLHAFLQVCKEEGMPVVLRIGPFCHGEVYQGGFPEWVVERHVKDPKNYKLRSTAPGFIAETQRLYSNIFAQASDMLWKHGGPVVGVQIENECRGPWNYYMTLKNMAISIGFDTPFYTRTGWPKLNGKEEFGKMLPLYGDYADGFWDRKLEDMPGDYPKAFIFKDTRLSAVIATEALGTNQSTLMEQKDLQYPYLTCELGGGMMPAYHRRINMSGNEAMPMAICKLGSGSNLPGYYMYHGGTNPYNPKHTMAETQASSVTNYNDMPLISYDFQCPLGEMGQPFPVVYNQTRQLHQFLQDWGEKLSQMDVDTLSEHYARRGCFEFHNDYVRILNEGGSAYVKPVEMPFMGHKVTADAQPYCKIGEKLYFIAIKDKKPMAYIDSKKVMLKADKAVKVNGISLMLLSDEMARKAFKIDDKIMYAKHDGGILYKAGDKVVEEWWAVDPSIVIGANKTKQAGAPRKVALGTQKVAAMPTDEDFEAAEVYALDLSAIGKDNIDNLFLTIDYAADCARVYADGILVEDNFWNGKAMLVRLSDLVNADGTMKRVELKMLPLMKDYPIYLQKQQKALLDHAPATGLLKLNSVKLLVRYTE